MLDIIYENTAANLSQLKHEIAYIRSHTPRDQLRIEDALRLLERLTAVMMEAERGRTMKLEDLKDGEAGRENK